MTKAFLTFTMMIVCANVWFDYRQAEHISNLYGIVTDA